MTLQGSSHHIQVKLAIAPRRFGKKEPTARFLRSCTPRIKDE